MKSKILLVEDNEMNREILVRRLTRKGFDLVLAENGVTGISKAGSEKPDLILMDMSLPEMDGWEATRAIKENTDTQKIPIIALTAHAMEQDRDSAMEAGCDDYDSKPVNFERLLGKINALISSG